MTKDVFAYVDTDGEGHLPLNAESHIRDAMARWNQTRFESPAKKEGARRKIVAAARTHKIELSDSHPVRPTRAKKKAA